MNEIKLDKFKPRDFQYAFCDALENKKYRKLIAIHPRRARQRFNVLELDDSCCPA